MCPLLSLLTDSVSSLPLGLQLLPDPFYSSTSPGSPSPWVPSSWFPILSLALLRTVHFQRSWISEAPLLPWPSSEGPREGFKLQLVSCGKPGAEEGEYQNTPASCLHPRGPCMLSLPSISRDPSSIRTRAAMSRGRESLLIGSTSQVREDLGLLCRGWAEVGVNVLVPLCG